MHRNLHQISCVDRVPRTSPAQRARVDASPCRPGALSQKEGQASSAYIRNQVSQSSMLKYRTVHNKRKAVSLIIFATLDPGQLTV
jgi:hypothetical protein